MLKFEANGKCGKVIINLPTKLEEITNDYLDSVTKIIQVADHYSLVALCHKEKLSAFVMAGRSTKNNISTAVVPMFVKHGKVASDSFNAYLNIGDRLLISPTALSLGLHVNVPDNSLNLSKVMAIIDGDGYAYQNAAKITEPVYFLEFKLVPNNEIIGVYKTELKKDFENPFAFEIGNDGE